MTALAWLIPVALLLGGLGLAGFLWSLKSGQFEDIEGAGWRALEDGAPGDPPARPRGSAMPEKMGDAVIAGSKTP